MPYTFVPKEKHARAFGRNVRVSTKTAEKICRVITKKPLTRSKRLLADLLEGRRSLRGKYHAKTVAAMLRMLESCEKNAEFLDLDKDRLMVHASAHQGSHVRRRRRKAAFGSRMKYTNIEVMLVERGRLQEKKRASVVRVKDAAAAERVAKEIAAKMKAKAPEAPLASAPAGDEGKEQRKENE